MDLANERKHEGAVPGAREVVLVHPVLKFVSKLAGVSIELTGSPPTKAAAFHLLVCHISDHSHARSINEARELQEQVQVASIVQFCQHRS